MCLTFTDVAPSVHWVPALGLGKYYWIVFKTSFTLNTRKFHNSFHLLSLMLGIALNAIRGITDIASNVVCARPVTVATRTLTVARPFIVIYRIIEFLEIILFKNKSEGASNLLPSSEVSHLYKLSSVSLVHPRSIVTSGGSSRPGNFNFSPVETDRWPSGL